MLFFAIVPRKERARRRYIGPSPRSAQTRSHRAYSALPTRPLVGNSAQIRGVSLAMPDTIDYTPELPALRELAERCRHLASVAGHPVRMRLFELATAIERHAQAYQAARGSRRI
jgi:hypothetical protein